jgi:hypothetical protein
LTEERNKVRERVLALARSDDRVSGGAVTGSAVVGEEDRWSDIDLSFGIKDGVPLELVLDEWTRALASDLGVAHHWDLRLDPTTYRIILLLNGLQVDLAVTPAAEFGPRGPKFQLVFGEGEAREPRGQRSLDELIGMGWLSALAARTSIGRGKPWMAEYWASSVRDHALMLACIRFGEPPEYARGFDRLPADVLDPSRETLVRSLEANELRRALVKAVDLFMSEVGHAKPELGPRLGPALKAAIAI